MYFTGIFFKMCNKMLDSKMHNSLYKYNNTDKETKAKEYILSYIKELQRHFDLSNKSMRNILQQLYKEEGMLYSFLRIIKKKVSMVKLFNKKRRK